MPVARFFLSQDLVVGQQVIIDGDEFQHLAKVIRVKPGEHVELVNGLGFLAEAIVDNILKREAQLSVQKILARAPPERQIILAQAIPRLNRLDNLIEKCTELGMTELWLFPGERSERKELSGSQIDRLNNVIISALKQCGRLHLPKIVLKPPISSWDKQESQFFFGDLAHDAPLLFDAVNEIPKKSSLMFCTGPESGFSPVEIEHLKSIGGKGVKLHGNILRTDTASIVAVALLTHK